MPNAYPTTVTVNVGALSIEDVVAVARYGAQVEIAPAALEEVAATRERVEELAQDPTPVYGISTGFGALARRHIPEEMRAQLQLSLVRSHAAGTGPEVEEEVIRALMLLRLSTLCTGRTGVRPVVVETYAKALNAGIVPVVREYGSLGCSGDLAPLAHCALALLGEGEVRVNGELQDAGEALAAAGIEPLQLREKEGLALINGTDGMLGQLCLAITDLRAAAKTADIATAMTVEGLLGTLVVFADDLQQLRPHPGQADAAANILQVAEGSEILEAALEEFKKNQVQDAYSVRCAPQVAGGFRDTLTHTAQVAERTRSAQVVRIPALFWAPLHPFQVLVRGEAGDPPGVPYHDLRVLTGAPLDHRPPAGAVRAIAQESREELRRRQERLVAPRRRQGRPASGLRRGWRGRCRPRWLSLPPARARAPAPFSAPVFA